MRELVAISQQFNSLQKNMTKINAVGSQEVMEFKNQVAANAELLNALVASQTFLQQQL